MGVVITNPILFPDDITIEEISGVLSIKEKNIEPRSFRLLSTNNYTDQDVNIELEKNKRYKVTVDESAISPVFVTRNALINNNTSANYNFIRCLVYNGPGGNSTDFSDKVSRPELERLQGVHKGCCFFEYNVYSSDIGVSILTKYLGQSNIGTGQFNYDAAISDTFELNLKNVTGIVKVWEETVN